MQVLRTTNERRVAKRVAFALHTRLRYSGLEYGEITISDLSFTGFRGATSVPLKKGDLVSVALPDIGLVRAAIKWCDDGEVAGAFLKAVDIRSFIRARAN